MVMHIVKACVDYLTTARLKLLKGGQYFGGVDLLIDNFFSLMKNLISQDV